MRIVFLGTPAVAAEYLPPLAAEHDLVGVVTQPDRQRGRGRKLAAPPVKEVAVGLGVPVLQPRKLLDDHFQQELGDWAGEAFVVVAYGRIVPRSIIEMPTKASVNVHYSLLPKLRGPAPVQRALLEGLTESGVTVQYVAEGLDEGDIILQEALAIEPEDNALTLTQRLTGIAIPLLLEALELIVTDRVVPRAQDHDAATTAPLVGKSEGIINWCRPAQEIVNQVRGCFPWPGAVCLLEGQRIKITRAVTWGEERTKEGNCGQVVEVIPDQGFVVRAKEGSVFVEQLQPAGRRIVSAADFLRGARLEEGVQLEAITL